MKTCQRCGQEVLADARLCPNCGQELPPVWPPPPGGPVPPRMPPPPGNSNQSALGVVLGFFLVPPLGVVALMTLGSLPFHNFVGRMLTSSVIVGAPALGAYFATRRRHPAFARAFGWTALAMFTVTLGALALCAGLAAQEGG